MPIPFNIGVLQLSMEPVRETLAMAKACEDAGFDTFWIAEAYPWWRKHSFEARSSTAILAVIAAQTRRIQLGWGIISPYTRHPVQIAMEARVMQDLAGERFLLGLGASKIFMKEIGEGEGEKVGPATVMRESIEIIKGVLKGDAFEYQGRVFAANVPPLRPDADTPRGIPPIYIAGTGPVLQKMAGSIGDGLLTASITTPAFVRYSRKNMEEGARKAGKDSSTLVLGSVIVGSIHRDSAKGKEGAREQAAMYLANKVQNIKGSADRNDTAPSPSRLQTETTWGRIRRQCPTSRTGRGLRSRWYREKRIARRRRGLRGHRARRTNCRNRSAEANPRPQGCS